MKIELYAPNKQRIATSTYYASGNLRVGTTVTFPLEKELEEAMKKEMHLVLYDEAYGILTFSAHFIESYYRGDKVFFIYGLDTLLNTVQRRTEIKVKTNFNIILHLLGQDVPSRISARVADLSAGGMFIITDAVLHEQQEFEFLFCEGGKPLRVHGRILRVQPVADHNGYGCQFTGLSMWAESVLRGYIFKVQTQKRRRADRS